MNPTHSTLLSQATLAHLAGEVGTAKKNYKLLLELDGKNPEVLFQLSLLFWDTSDLSNAIKYMKLALIQHQKDPAYWELLVCLYVANKKNQLANTAAEGARNFGHKINRKQDTIARLFSEQYLVNAYLNGQYFLVIWMSQRGSTRRLTSAASNLQAMAYSKLGDQTRAEQVFQEALLLDPKNPFLLSNYGLLLKNQKRYERAVETLHKAVKLERNSANIFNNLAVSYEELGDLSNASLMYKKALKCKQENATVYLNYLSLCTQLNLFGDRDGFKHQVPSKEFKYLILKVISGLLNRDFTACRKYLNYIKLEYERLVSDPIDGKFVHGYYKFLRELLPSLKSNNTETSLLFHLGESHSLSFSWQEVLFRGELHRLRPMTTFGAKAYHFTTAGNNKYKAITDYNISQTPKECSVLVSFGEIDCRSDEGFIRVSRKLGVDSKDLIKDVVLRYVGWFEQYSAEREFLFFNLPAPTYKEEISQALNHEVATNIETYNTHLLDVCIAKGFSVIDLYSVTKMTSGFSNNLYHVDGFHVGPTVLPKLHLSDL